MPVSAALGLAAYTAFCVPEIERVGWRSAVPDIAVAWLAPASDAGWKWNTIWPGFRFGMPGNAWTVEAMRRIDARTMTGLSSQVFLGRFYSAFPDQARRVVQVRDRWPAGLPMRVRIGFAFPMRQYDDLIIRVRVGGSGDSWSERRFGDWSNSWIDLGTPPEGEMRIEAQILVAGPEPALMWSGVIRRIRVGGLSKDILTSLAGDERAAADESVAMLEPGLGVGAEGSVKLVLNQNSRHLAPTPPDWALGVRCEVLHDGALAASGTALYLMVEPGIIVDSFSSRQGFELQWTEPEPREAQLRTGDWRIRLTGDPDVAMSDFDRTTYWGGRVTNRITGLESLTTWDDH